MAARTTAQEEFDSIVSKASGTSRLDHHPSDTDDYRHDRPTGEQDEETEYAQKRVDENMRMPSLDPRGGVFHLPHRDFDSGRTTGVKGVIADARSYEEARRTGSYRGSRGNSSTRDAKRASSATFLNDDGEGSASEEEEFIERWRAQRRQELSTIGNDIRNRRTSPSVRRYGRFDEVDAMGYLDAIEKVTRDTIVVVFVYDHEVYCPLSFVSQPRHTNSVTVPCLPNHLRRPCSSGSNTPRNPLCPRPLRRYRVRQRRRARDPSLQEPRRPFRKPHLHHRSNPRRYFIRYPCPRDYFTETQDYMNISFRPEIQVLVIITLVKIMS